MSYSGESPTKEQITLTGQVVYLGDENTDGSWRFSVSGGNLLIEVRVAGVWTTKDEIQP